jgi:aspartokinase
MDMGLINIRALADYIITEEKVDGTIDAVISALRRYEPDGHEEIYANAQKIIGKIISISTRSKIISISLVKDSKIQQLLPQLFSIIHYNRGDVLRIAQADESIKILIDGRNLEKIQKLIPKELIKGVEKNLAEINVHQHPDTIYTPGVIAIISNDLAMNNINIIETVSCFPEWIWIVEEKDLLTTYKVIYQLWRECQTLNNENNL